MSFEESLIWHASPTLANIKIANLYNYKFSSKEVCLRSIRRFNAMMNPKGIFIELLKSENSYYLIYVYRRSSLEAKLQDKEIMGFLSEFGYSSRNGVAEYLEHLKRRLEETDFPHEIGVFLGYPLADVKAFIRTKGKGCTLCGEWKAYNDVETARCLFCKYKHCKEIYVKVHREGRKLSDMLVGA